MISCITIVLLQTTSILVPPICDYMHSRASPEAVSRFLAVTCLDKHGSTQVDHIAQNYSRLVESCQNMVENH